MTKRELSQLYYLRKEIKKLRKKREEMEGDSTFITQIIDGMPHPQGISDKTGRFATELAYLSLMIKNKEEQCVCEYMRLMMYINGIEDSEMRQIMTHRYIEGKTWQQVAFSMGEMDESYPRRKHNSFLKLAENAESNVIK